MEIAQLLRDLIFDYTLRTVALGAAILGLTSGVLGAFAVLRKQSLLGDAISHAALPGIAIAFLLTGSKEAFVLVLGAIAAGWLATVFIMLVTGRTRLKQDAALGISLAVFFGFGLLLLTYIQRLPNASKAGLDKFLFGQTAALLGRDVFAMTVLGGIALAAVIVFWKEFKLLAFDADFAGSMGFSVRGLEVLLTALTVIAIVVGLQTVGVVLMSAMLVAPAAAARQWTDRLGAMVALSGSFGAAAGLLGAVASSQVPHLPTGPTIVVLMSIIVIASLLFAPRRGILAGARRRQRQRWHFAQEALVVHLLQHEGSPDEARESALGHMIGHMRWNGGFARRVVSRAVRDGLVATEGSPANSVGVSPGGPAPDARPALLQLTDYGREVARRAMVR